MNPDKEIRDQEAFEKASLTSEDKKLYAMLFDELNNDSGLEIKPSFSAEVLKKLEAKRKKEAWWEFFLFGSAIVGVALLVLLGASFAKQALKSSPDILKGSPLAPALLFAGLLILFQFIDKKYLRDSRIKRKLKQG